MLRKSEGLICSHILIGLRAEAMLEAGMRLAPGERQSGDGTSLPETPNNLTNVCNTVQYPIRKDTSLADASSKTSHLICVYTFPPYKLSAVYAELENMYSAKRSKSLKSRPPPAPESFLDLEPPSRTSSPTIHVNTGS